MADALPVEPVAVDAAPAPPPVRRRPTALLRRGATQESLASSLRLGLLLLAALVAPPLGSGAGPTLLCLVGVILLAIVGSRLRSGSRARLAVLLGESLLIGLGVVTADEPALALLLCLPSTTIAAGVSAGYAGCALTGGTTAAVLLVGRVLRNGEPGVADFSSAAAQWVLVALISGALAARIHSLAGERGPTDHYAEAHRLLAQLRAVTRGLDGSLDPGTVAQILLEECCATGEAGHGAVLLHVGGEQLVPLALTGYRRVPWRADLNEEGPITQAWRSAEPVVDRRLPDDELGRTGSTLLVLPVCVDGQHVGVVALEWRPHTGFSADRLPALEALVARWALPLETAALFDELRIAAAAEERSRLAREMHDGIAQDLAFLGYSLDALTASLRRSGSSPEAVEQARALRTHMTSLISDLRLSISDLRSSVGPGRGLGAALSEYARSAGTSSGITVHLSLKEGSTRLPADTEVQLLRIAHEAVGRARRRPGTRNLWVTLEADPPTARLVVEDDAPSSDISTGNGTSDTREMDERALKLGARFSAEPRLPIGNRISVDVGGPPP